MTKSRRSREEHRNTLPIPERYRHLIAAGILFLSLLVFFREVIFEGKTFLPPDTIASLSFQTLVSDADEQGIFPLWNPYIFCGMPGYASATIHGERLFDVSAFLMGKLSALFSLLSLNSDIGWVLFYYFLFGLGMYFLTLHLSGDWIAAIVVALGALFSTYMINWVMIGHMTKMPVLAFFPYILLIAEKLRWRFHLHLALALPIVVHFLLLPTHAQIIFYVYFALGIYYLFFIIRALLKKEDWKGPIRSGIILAAATGIAFLMTADGYLSLREYLPHSIRGASPIVTTQQESATSGGALDYDYATNWSFSPGEMTTFAVPSWYGFGWHTYRGPLSQNQEMRLNTYIGPQPFTDAPPYLGAVVLVFAAIGFVRRRKEPFVQFLGILIVLALLISFGKEFSLLFDLMFNHFPFFNKFRAPSMILVLVQTSVPLLAGYGIASLLTDPKINEKRWKYAMGAAAGLFILALIGKGILRTVYEMFFSVQDVALRLSRSYGQLQEPVVAELYSFIFSSVATDILIGALLVLVCLVVVYLNAKSKVSLSLVAAILPLAIVVDAWRVTSKPMETHEASQKQQLFTTPDYVKYLLQDSTQFRVLEFINGQPPYNNSLAYWRIQSAYGYQGAKMRAYQDMIDVAGIYNPLLWQLMNVKYIITNRPDSASFLGLAYDGPDRKVYVNRLVYPRAFFVNRYEVASGFEILNKIATQSFNPRDVAYFLDDPKLQLDPAPPINTIEWVRYGIQDLVLNVTAAGNNLLFLSEAYYPEGWKAFLDGNETPIHRINYMFRGVVVPPGSHRLEMRFEPQGFYVGKTISLIANLLMLGGIAGFVLAKRGKRLLPGRPSFVEQAPEQNTR